MGQGRAQQNAPRLVNGSFFLLGGHGAAEELRRFTLAYLAVFGERAARALADLVELTSPARLCQALADAEDAGCDEFILVPGTVDLDCLQRTVTTLGG